MSYDGLTDAAFVQGDDFFSDLSQQERLFPLWLEKKKLQGVMLLIFFSECGSSPSPHLYDRDLSCGAGNGQSLVSPDCNLQEHPVPGEFWGTWWYRAPLPLLVQIQFIFQGLIKRTVMVCLCAMSSWYTRPTAGFHFFECLMVLYRTDCTPFGIRGFINKIDLIGVHAEDQEDETACWLTRKHNVPAWQWRLWVSHLLFFFPSPDSPPTRTTQVSSVFFGSQDLGRDCSFIKPLASTPGNKTLPIGEFVFRCHDVVASADNIACTLCMHCIQFSPTSTLPVASRLWHACLQGITCC